MNRIALNMIVKGTADEAPLLERALESAVEHVDGVFLYVNTPEGVEPDKAVLDVVDRYNATYKTGTWKQDFSEARTRALELVPEDYEWVMWLDTDDTLEGGEELDKAIANIPKHIDAVFMEYLYDHDEHGNVLTTHWVLRLFRNHGRLQWKGRLHETLIDVVATTKGRIEAVKVKHHASKERRDASLQRNADILREVIQEESDDPDARTFFYLAGAEYDLGNLMVAHDLYKRYLELSGWDAERSQAWTQMGRIAIEVGDNSKAQVYFLNAMGENCFDIEPWVELGSLKLKLKDIEQAIHWLDLAVIKQPNLNAPTRNIVNERYRPFMLLAEAHMNKGGKNLDHALKFVDEALKYRDDENTNNFRELILNLQTDRDTMRKLAEDVKDVTERKEADKLLAKVPKHLRDHPTYLSVKRRFRKPKTWSNKSIVIFTGKTALEDWGPWSLETGIGGSEEAVVRLSRQLTDKGWKVTVYANPGAQAGTYDGVEWRNYWEIDMRDEFNVFVAWRMPWLFDNKINAKKSYLWLHDVIPPQDLMPSRLQNLEKVIVVSEYHRTLFPDVPDDKMLVSGNGIDAEEFEAYDGKIDRDPHRMIYASSHVRGLTHLLNIWPEVKKAVPDATLDIYYGWESYDAINRNNPERMAWKEQVVKAIDSLDGVTDHGRVSQEKIVEASFASGLWAYPCEFPEVYCITAVKSQCAGAIPVSTNYAALDETVQFGTKYDISDGFDEKEYLKLLLEALDEQDEDMRKEMMEWNRKNRGWDKVADQWLTEFTS